jgi:bleomycin hydrolase
MNKFISACFIFALLSGVSYAQKKGSTPQIEPYRFETVVENPVTSIKDQASSGTCWCFSGLSFIESEIIRSTGEECDLSEMFVVSNAYYDKALKYVRMHGHLNFGPGSSFSDVLAVLETYGIVPESEMTGLNYGTQQHNHFEMDEVLKGIVSALVKNPNMKLSKAWKTGFRDMVAAYLGEIPTNFTVNGEDYTPKSYLASLGIDMSDYVDISSWTHHPFYETMVLEVPDNWRGRDAYNVPLDDMMAIIDNALDNGYTVAWASDVSEDGFTGAGIAVVPDMTKTAQGSDQVRWIGSQEINGMPLYMQTPCPEMVITQELRQEGFDDYSTTDDHGMHIYGKAVDQNGTEYYMVKNSWGSFGPYDGVWYVSKAYVMYKTTDIVVNRNAIPSEIREKLGL